MKRIIGLAITFGFVAAMACGGNVVVDPPGAGGSSNTGGSSPTSNASTTSSGMGGFPNCTFPPPVGNAVLCGGSGSVGSGQPLECGELFCDNINNLYETLCSQNTCTCIFNGQTICNCSVPSGDICLGSAAPCCPFPFPH